MLNKKERFKKKKQAVELRCHGFTYPEIEKKIGVVRATLSGWFAGLKLPVRAQARILQRKRIALQSARMLAADSHRNKHKLQRAEALQEVSDLLETCELSVATNLALLSMLYLGEGFKRKSSIALGNSNPEIIRVFIHLLKTVFHPRPESLRCFLYLRYDQDASKEIAFWSKVTGVAPSLFRKSHHDRRTLGKKTWINYHGVCAVHCYDASIEKRLTAAQKVILERVLMGG